MNLLRNSLVAALLVTALPCAAPAEEEAQFPVASLERLVAESDLVALVQVADTDYEYARDFPVGGSAFLRVLIPYRLTGPVGELVQVYEEGLHAHECYFENPEVGREGRRFLVFLRRHPRYEGQFEGLDPGCALEVLVTADNRYALRYPPSGIELSDDLGDLVRPLDFQDRYAQFEDEDMTVAERNRLLEDGHLERFPEGYRYTHGVALSDIRKRLGDAALTLDRNLRRPQETPPTD